MDKEIKIYVQGCYSTQVDEDTLKEIYDGEMRVSELLPHIDKDFELVIDSWEVED